MDTPNNTPQITVQPTHDFREDYANSVMLKTSLWDFCFLFGRIEQGGPNTMVVKNFSGLFISPQQAKALHGVLGENLAGYEKQFGPIVIQPINQMPGGAGKPS